MKFLIVIAVAAVLGSVHCDKECFRAIFKECMKEPVPMSRMTLCDEIRNQVDCISDKAFDCKMPFKRKLRTLADDISSVCDLKEILSDDFQKHCYVNCINDHECAGPINEVLKNLDTQEKIILANKQICNLFETYATCVEKKVNLNCHDDNLLENLFRPYRDLSSSLCEHLIRPAEEKDSRPDNFGRLNIFSTLNDMFSTL